MRLPQLIPLVFLQDFQVRWGDSIVVVLLLVLLTLLCMGHTPRRGGEGGQGGRMGKRCAGYRFAFGPLH